MKPNIAALAVAFSAFSLSHSALALHDLPYVLQADADAIDEALRHKGFPNGVVSYETRKDVLTVNLQERGTCWLAKFELNQKGRALSHRTFIFTAMDDKGLEARYVFPADSIPREMSALAVSGLATLAIGGGMVPEIATPFLSILGVGGSATSFLVSDSYEFMIADMPRERKHAIGEATHLLRKMVVANKLGNSAAVLKSAESLAKLCSSHL